MAFKIIKAFRKYIFVLLEQFVVLRRLFLADPSSDMLHSIKQISIYMKAICNSYGVWENLSSKGMIISS